MKQKEEAKWIMIGTLCVAVSQILCGLNEVIVKASKLPITQCLMGRFFIQFLISVIWWNIKKPKNPLIFNYSLIGDSDDDSMVIIKNWYGDHPYILNIWLRGIVFSICNGILFWYSVDRLPLGDLQCIFYQSPLWTVYIGSIWLKEKLPKTPILISSTTLTIAGIILVSQPSFILNTIDPSNYQLAEPLNIDGIITTILAALGWSFGALLIRTAINTHFLQLEFASSGCSIIIAVPITLIITQYFSIHNDVLGNIETWKFDIYSFLIILFLGISGFGVLSLSVIGYQSGSATMVSWLEYITVPIAFIYQIFIFNDLPNKYETIGAILITIGCLLPVIHPTYVYFNDKVDDNDQQDDTDHITTDAEEDVHLMYM